jgi:isopentenyl diphosphate isomerase/L-lactate dehydrogenase-like FMN-dependent dehydrogenase
MEVLPEIVDATAGRAKVMIDGSFCRGTDVIKAIAAGADMVALGRMQCYALAAGGEAAIVRMLELIEDEARRSLALLGVASFAEPDRSYLHPAAPTTSPGALGAFPLLDIEDDCG